MHMAIRTAHPRTGDPRQTIPEPVPPEPELPAPALEPGPSLPPIRDNPESTRRCYRPLRRFTRPEPINADEAFEEED